MAATIIRPTHFPLLALPLELRHAVYGYVLFSGGKKVEVVSNLQDCQSEAKMRLYTIRDLRLLETNRQTRAEACDVLYSGSVFTLYSYSRKQDYGQKPLYGRKCYRIDFARIHKFHFLTPSGTAPLSHSECLKGAQNFGNLLQGVVRALAIGHTLRFLLIESYFFERAVFAEELTMQHDISHTLRALEEVQGVQHCHIRAMKISHWPYLRFLEKRAMKSWNDAMHEGEPRQSVWDQALLCKKAFTSADVNGAFGDPDIPKPNKIFEVFGIEPLYRDLDFLDNYEDDIL